MTLEEHKIMVAEWMGHYKGPYSKKLDFGGYESGICWYNGDTKETFDIKTWNPNSNPAHLAEVLANLDDDQFDALLGSIYFNSKEYLRARRHWAKLFQNPDNAPVIWKALCRVLEGN